MNATAPSTHFKYWRNDALFGIDFAAYSLSRHSFPRHFHDHFVIELVTEGADRFYCDGKNYTAAKGRLVLINPGEVHTGNSVADTPLRYYSFYPDSATLQRVADSLQIPLPRDFCFHQSMAERPRLGDSLQRLFRSLDKGTDPLGQQEIFSECMQELLQPAMENEKAANILKTPDKRIELVKEYLQIHYQENIRLSQLAALVSLSPVYLIRLFKKTTGMSPYDYLLALRTDKARQLLRGGCTVGEAAGLAGFYDHSHFHRMFYRVTGTTPKNFRLSKSQYHTNPVG